MSNTKCSLNGNTIKIIAIIAMLIDHTGWAFVGTNTGLAMIMHTIGKLTGPIMFYFIAEGNHYTHNVKKYICRLAIFALISHIPYNIFANEGKITLLPTSVIFTLLCGLLALIAYKRINNMFLKSAIITVLCILTFRADWGIFGVLFILAFGIFYGDFNKQIIAYSVLCVMKIIYSYMPIVGETFSYYTLLPRFGMFLVIPILFLYNGKRGGNKYMKWLFYIIYPLQFLIIGALTLLV